MREEDFPDRASQGLTSEEYQAKIAEDPGFYIQMKPEDWPPGTPKNAEGHPIWVINVNDSMEPDQTEETDGDE